MNLSKLLDMLDEANSASYGTAEDMWRKLTTEGKRTVKNLRDLQDKIEGFVELFDRVALSGTPPPKNKDGVRRLEKSAVELRQWLQGPGKSIASVDGGIKLVDDMCHWLANNEY